MNFIKTGKGLAADIIVLLPNGVHARPAANIARTAKNFESDILIVSDYGEVDGKSMLDILSLALSTNDAIRLIANGSDAEKALTKLAPLFSG